MKIYVTVLLFFTVLFSFGQVGIGTTTPNNDAILEVSATNKGMIIPRLALSATNSFSPLSAHVAGMVVYNTATAGTSPNQVTPGMYYNNGSNWERLVIPSELPKARGIERITTTSAIQFTKVGTDFIWTAGGAAGSPAFVTTANVWAPYGSTTSYVTVTPGANATTPDTFVCSKNIVSLRFYTEIQVSVANTSRWRTNLFLNGVVAGTSNYWGAPPNNQANVRVFGVLEYGPIPAGTSITVRIDANTLPNSTQNNGSYFVIEYEL